VSTIGSGEIANIFMYMNRNQKPSFRRIIKENRIRAYTDAGSETTLIKSAEVLKEPYRPTTPNYS
jgi:hypothetical protein